MTRTRNQAAGAGESSSSGNERAGIQQLVEELDGMLSRLRSGAIREQLDGQPSIDPARMGELATCRWVANGDNMVLLGPPGVGKTQPKWLIIDELGTLPLEPAAGHLLFQLISRRYEQGSVLISSNQQVEEWDEVITDQVVAAAILDRLLHHSHVVMIRGDSVQQRGNSRRDPTGSND